MLIIVVFFGAILLFANNGINRNVEQMLGRNPMIMLNNDMPRRPDMPIAFTVNVNAHREASGVTSPFSMSKEFYEEAATQAINKKANTGRIKVDGLNLAYRNNGNSVIFMDISREVAMFNSLIYIFLLIAIPLIGIIFLASLYFANRSILPIESAFIKQKEFVADASHELKTPLATISTNADVLLQETPSKWITHIKKETGRMASIVDSLLYLAKIDYEDKSKFASVNLSEVLNDVLLPLEAVIHEQNVELKVNCADGVVVQGDRDQIHRLFGILLDNAIKYTSGKISVSIDKGAQIIVQNSGEPIPPEKLEKLFERFYRVDESHQYTGSFGLGLSIAKAIVDSHNGKISCKSDEINGTKFIVRI